MFLRTHMIISTILGVMIWVHLWWPKELIEIVLVVGTSCVVASFIVRYVLQIFRNTSVRKLEITRLISTQPFGDCMVVSLMVPHAWTIEPGQYVYLTLLTTRALSFAQRHPFVITWWDAEPGSTSSKTLYLMIEPRNGWSRRIIQHKDQLRNVASWLAGPFGHRRDIHEYGCVLFFATGAGMFAILPFVKRLTELTQDSAANTRKIKVVWYTDQEEAVPQLHPWMQSLLDTSVLDKSVSSSQ